MAGRLSFSIAVNLLTENFKKGTNSVKAGFRAMQMQVLTFAAALGAGGLGLSNFISRLIDVARETNRVNTALKNVSGSLSQYADNQRFVIDMANKYGIEVNALTGNFAKFTAAASVSGMSMEKQRKIFESVSRACTAFGMSADDSNGVFLALSQMMSKGKISSEELRLQMGERLPIALQAMAKAAGVPVSKLDKLLKQGKLMSADVLPKFADALNEMIPNIDTDNIETSVNRLKNAFTDFTNNTNIQSYYKNIIDWLTGLVGNAAKDIKGILINLSGIISGVILGKLFKWIQAELVKSQRAAMVAASKVAKAAGESFDEVKWKAQSGCETIKTAFKRASIAIKSALASIAPMLLAMAITEIVTRLVQISREAKRLKNLFSDYKKEAEGANSTTEIEQLKTLRKMADDINRPLKERRGIWIKIGEYMGEIQRKNESDLQFQERINAKYKDRIKLLQTAAEVDYYTRKKLETEGKIREVKYNISESVNSNDVGGFPNPWNGPLGIKTLWNQFNPYNGNVKNIQSGIKELNGLEMILKDVSSKLEKAMSGDTSTNDVTPPILDDDDDKEKKTEFEKAQEKYAKSLLELDAELKINKITQQEYNKALDELNQSALVEAMTIKDGSIAKSEYFKKLQQNVANPTYNESQAEAEKAQKEYNEELDKYKNRLAAGNLSQKQYDEKVKELNSSTLELIASILGAAATTDEFYQNLLKNTPKPDMPVMPQFEDVDHTFDYKKTDLEKRQDEYEVAKGNLDKLKSYQNELKDKFPELAKEMEKEINAAMSNVKTMGEALKLEEVREDIKNLSKELNEGLYSGVKGVVSNIDGMVSSWQRLSDVMSDVDASGWERIMAVWEAMTSTVDSILQIIEIIDTLTKVVDSLALAKEKEAVIDSATTTTKVTNAGISAGADIMEAGVKKSTASETVAANTAESASETGKSAAKSLPFPLNILAIAGAIAATYAAFSAISKFANGGIVGGSSYSGDKIIAGVNSGEMIINQSQQRRLFEIANGKGNTGGGSSIVVTGEAKLRGDTAFIQIANYMKRTGKRLPR